MSYTLTPEQVSLLNLALKTWKRRASAKRHGMFYGEETITETNLLDLTDTFPGLVSIVQFNKMREGGTGADWAWSFVSADGRHNMPMLVQAKLLDLNDTEYPEIKRLIGKRKPSIRQIDQTDRDRQALGVSCHLCVLQSSQQHTAGPEQLPVPADLRHRSNAGILGRVRRRCVQRAFRTR